MMNLNIYLCFLFCYFQFFAAVSLSQSAPANSGDIEKIRLLDRKFRTRVATQDSAFTYNHIQDGVELGCWGYIKNGSPFRMFYVYDMKDYRFITTTLRFQVHPPNGKKR
jgi:hypothetical protein